jgi:hypothetical protein
MITAVFCELLDGVVIRKYIAVNASHQWYRDFQDGYKKVIGGLADLLITH